MMSVSDFIYCLLSCYFMLYIYILCYRKMDNLIIKKSFKFVLCYILFGLLLLINNLYNAVSLRFFGIIIIITLYNAIAFKNNIMSSIIYSFSYTLIMTILEFMISPIITLNIDSMEYFNNNILLKISFSVIISLLSLYIMGKNKIIDLIKKLINLTNKDDNLYKIIFIILIFCDFLVFIRALEINNMLLIILTVISTLFIIFFINILINDKYNLTILNERNKNIKEHFEAYSKTIDDCRELKHNLRNDLYTIKSVLNKEDQEKINIIINKYNKNYEWINMIDEIPEGLQGIIYLKQKEAKNKKIVINVNTNKTIKTNLKDYVDISSILGILIDNALDATYKTKSKIIEINLCETKKYLYIKIMNNFCNDIDLTKIGNKNYSTKEFKSGLGLNFIKKVNNPKIKVNFNIVNNLFITDIKYNFQ